MGRFLIRAQDQNMTNGDFAWFTWDPVRSSHTYQPCAYIKPALGVWHIGVNNLPRVVTQPGIERATSRSRVRRSTVAPQGDHSDPLYRLLSPT